MMNKLTRSRAQSQRRNESLLFSSKAKALSELNIIFNWHILGKIQNLLELIFKNLELKSYNDPRNRNIALFQK